MVNVSIIMPVYNAEKYLNRAIDSVLKQTFKDVELICVNDGSEDSSIDILNDYSSKYDFIKVYSIENSGSGFARNVGIEKATGKYIAFLDADDEFLDVDALEKMYTYGNKYDADMIAANQKQVNEQGKVLGNFNYDVGNYMFFSKKEIINPIDYGIPWAFYKNMYKLSFIKNNEITFPNLLRGQDPVFLSSILTKIDEIYGVNTDLYGYHNQVSGGPDSKINDYKKKYDYIKHFKESFDILKNNDFENTYENFKVIFTNYLKKRENYYDDDFKIIIPEVFGDLSEYFDTNSYDYAFIKNMIGNYELDDVNEELNDFKSLKKDLFEETLTNDHFIDYEKLKSYTSLINQNTDKNTEIQLLSFETLKTLETEVNEDYEYLNEKIDDIDTEISQLNKSNDSILSSKSWKSTEFLRSVKHLYKK